jgi:hypothetical protein
MHPIPYIPTHAQFIGYHARNMIETTWREAIAWLFACQCSICLRASGLPPRKERQVTTEDVSKRRPIVAIADVPPVKPSRVNEAPGEEDLAGSDDSLEVSRDAARGSSPLRRSREREDEGYTSERKRFKVDAVPP